ncbi:LuxR C-terminal-related transcriptional regulator [Streptomyces bobili]|uniref:LuxR C-terminal-related transcriptional regulator n=1 Tax=Streptomyces bobili TaxID=67280 RepID=UPI00379FAD9A
MITVLTLRRHIVAVADELNLPLTLRQVDQLTNRVALRSARGKASTLHLTNQMYAVLVGLASGEEVEQTANRIGRSVDTVKSHRRRLYKALEAENGPHAVAIAMNAGLLRTGGGA